MLSKITSRIRKHRAYLQTVRELSNLTDRELSDVGIGRSDIPSVARRGISGF